MAKERTGAPAPLHPEPMASASGGPERGIRECAVCGVRLSLYNPGPHCWNHTIGHPWRGPSAKPKF
jgi:hypothetical protein